jgi:tRNA threonylcarbamoyladenosine biosynthesis protein TsaB
LSSGRSAPATGCRPAHVPIDLAHLPDDPARRVLLARVSARVSPAPPVVLALDASTYRGSVAVLRDGRVLAERATAMRGADEERLMPAVAAALAEAQVPPAALAAIACGGGPGSFTSLRIAGAIAKGLATATGAPVLAVPSLALVAVAGTVAGTLAGAAAGGAGVALPVTVLATMDAMRGDRYAALVGLAVGAAGHLAVTGYRYVGVVPADSVPALARTEGADGTVDAGECAPAAAGVAALGLALPDGRRLGPAAGLAVEAVALDAWEPDYGRKAEAQVKWEAAHGRALPGAA